MKANTITDQSGKPSGVIITCPACGDEHVFDSRWTFNGDFDSPTFTPSMLARSGRKQDRVCHSFVTDGSIRFLGDCTHEHAGKTLELPDLREPWASVPRVAL